MGTSGEVRTRQAEGKGGGSGGVEEGRGCKVQAGVWGRWDQWGGVREGGREDELEAGGRGR